SGQAVATPSLLPACFDNSCSGRDEPEPEGSRSASTSYRQTQPVRLHRDSRRPPGRSSSSDLLDFSLRPICIGRTSAFLFPIVQAEIQTEIHLRRRGSD